MERIRRSLLIVDDDPNEVLFLRNAFFGLQEHFDIRHAESGEEALDAIRSDAPDLVLLDINMPGMNGYDVLDRIRGDDLTQGLPTLMFSSSERKDDIERSYRAYANAYVVKPRSSDGYLKLAENLGRFWYETARV